MPCSCRHFFIAWYCTHTTHAPAGGGTITHFPLSLHAAAAPHPPPPSYAPFTELTISGPFFVPYASRNLP